MQWYSHGHPKTYDCDIYWSLPYISVAFAPRTFLWYKREAECVDMLWFRFRSRCWFVTTLDHGVFVCVNVRKFPTLVPPNWANNCWSSMQKSLHLSTNWIHACYPICHEQTCMVQAWLCTCMYTWTCWWTPNLVMLSFSRHAACAWLVPCRHREMARPVT